MHHGEGEMVRRKHVRIKEGEDAESGREDRRREDRRREDRWRRLLRLNDVFQEEQSSLSNRWL